MACAGKSGYLNRADKQVKFLDVLHRNPPDGEAI